MIKTRTIHRLVKKWKCRLESYQIKNQIILFFQKAKKTLHLWNWNSKRRQCFARPPLEASGSSIRINSSGCFPAPRIPGSKIFLRAEINKTRVYPNTRRVPDKHHGLVRFEELHMSSFTALQNLGVRLLTWMYQATVLLCISQTFVQSVSVFFFERREGKSL